MKVLQIGTLDNKGGAAKVAYRLKQSLNDRGVETKMLVGDKLTDDADVFRIRNHGHRFVDRKLHLGGLVLPTRRRLRESPAFQSADVVHLHNLHGGYFNVLALPGLCREKPTLWTIHDPWAIQERGLTPEYCYTFRNERLPTRLVKASAIRRSRLDLVAVSNWMKSKLAAVFDDIDIAVIPNGIDLDVFRPYEKAEARRELGLIPTAKVALSVAVGFGAVNPDKGEAYIDLVQKEMGDSLQVLRLGEGDSYVADETTLAKYYAAADLFLLPSLAESASLVAMEAMACGTPVVAFRVGGIPELVDHGESGYLAGYKDGEDLIRGVELALSLAAEHWGRRARERAEADFSQEKMVSAYIEKYEELLERDR